MENVSKALGSREQTLRMKLGNRVKELRQARGLTQEQLAEHATVSPSFIGLIESGKKIPSLPTATKITRALKVPLFHLFMLDGEVPAKDRTVQELLTLLEDRPERDAKILLANERELIKHFP